MIKALISLALVLVLTFANNTEYNQLISDFSQALQKGDKAYLKEHVYPTATWSAPYQKLLRSRDEIIAKHNGISEGHQIVISDVEFTREENTLHVFGFFNYLQNQEVSHSGRFIGIFQVDRNNVYQLHHGLWQLDGSHLKDQQQQ